jgi:hypothetical protein
VEYSYGATVGAGFTTDISEGGTFVLCGKIAQPGVRIYLRIHLPGSRAGDPLKIIGTVARSTERFGMVHDARQGMGIQFEEAYAGTRETLHEFMQNLLVHPGAEEIEAVPGSLPAAPTYGVRLLPGGARDPMMNADEVSQAFSFDAPTDDQLPVRWDVLGTVTWRIAVWLLLAGVAAYLVARLLRLVP